MNTVKINFCGTLESSKELKITRARLNEERSCCCVVRKHGSILSCLLLLLSHFSHGRLCATPWTAAHQAPPSLGFSRQEHWSGLPFPSPMRESEVTQSCLTLGDPMDCSLPGSSVQGIFQARVLEWVAIAFSEVVCLSYLLSERVIQIFLIKNCNYGFQSLRQPPEGLAQWLALLSTDLEHSQDQGVFC